ncbi:hypothetical protein K493DRAFT_337498 [Basidiobolus meristosporus CBS 931.73]|uniref:Uncharacterized protein n=1 Tax=Basidiobolus meristosporus CBS 931.73 TaxID=1314790 RepID=A0A1Y1YAU0_9FUNG|nr:hypothetical protein K493DRAFT_337498 [Basidiobolus meristosporus CBS 931.73]|eukprot:ORX95127.1 hypothetical protein K493DRAFT_337498 [Basidiobolus meristosporus CBS 931.73]
MSEKHPERSKESRALGIHARTMEIFHNLDVAGVFLQNAFAVDGFNVYNRGVCISHFTLGHLDTQFASVYSIPQAKTEMFLHEHLTKTFGVTIERNTELLAFENLEDKVVARVKKSIDGNESEEIIEAKYLIGCDGAHSSVRKKLGLQFEGISMQNKWHFMDAVIETDLPSCNGMNTFLEDKGALLLIPMGDDVYRILLDTGSDDMLAEFSEEAYIRRAKSLVSPYRLDIKSVQWFTTFQVNERKVKEFSKGRVFICGDAAHIHSPAGGQGMNTGIQDAYNLAWKLSMVENHKGNRNSLVSSYTMEREPIAASVLEMSGALFRAFSTNNSLLLYIRSRIVSAVNSIPYVRNMMGLRVSGLAIEYPQGPLTVPHTGWVAQGPTSVRAGRRVPDIVFQNSTIKRLHDIFADFNGFRIVLWLPSGSAANSSQYLETLKTKVTGLHSRYDGNGSFLKPLIITDDTSKVNTTNIPSLDGVFGSSSIFAVSFDDVQARFGFTQNEPVALAVRPDGYLGIAMYLQDIGHIDDYFQRFMN